jgi:hypothetical protein
MAIEERNKKMLIIMKALFLIKILHCLNKIAKKTLYMANAFSPTFLFIAKVL